MRLHCISVAHSQFIQLKRRCERSEKGPKNNYLLHNQIILTSDLPGWMNEPQPTHPERSHSCQKLSKRLLYELKNRCHSLWSLLLRTRSSSEPMKMETMLLPDALRAWSVELLPPCTGLLLHTQWLPKDALDPCQAEMFSTFQGKENSLSPLPFREGKSFFPLCKAFLVSWEQFSLLFTRVVQAGILGPQCVKVWEGGIFQFPHRAYHICDRSRPVQAPVPYSTWKHCCHPFFFFILYFQLLISLP